MFDEIDRLCARRAQGGLKEHGLLDLANDPRNFIQELKEELLDSINYTRWAQARGELPEDIAYYIVCVLKDLIKLIEGKK